MNLGYEFTTNNNSNKLYSVLQEIENETMIMKMRNDMKRSWIEKRIHKHDHELFDITYDINNLHKYKPIIKNYQSNKGKTYTKYIMKLFDISESDAIIALKKYNYDVYKTIIYYMP
jgi:hypothetical protein